VVMPGFVDPHAHVELASTAAYSMVDCRAPAHSTIAEVLDELADAARGTSSNEWLVAQGNLFLDQKLDDRRLPTRHELDSVTTKRPIVLRAGGHTSVLNTRALERTGVAQYRGQSGMSGAAIVQLGDDGEPTGEVAELDAALGLPVLSNSELKQLLRVGVHDLFTRYGVTSVGEISDTIAGLEMMSGLAAAGELPIRVSAFLWAPGTVSLEQACSWTEHLAVRETEGRFDVRGVKLFADGGYSARNAATRTPYREPYAREPGSKGKINLECARIADAIRQASDAGLQLAVHANGERAQDVACDAARQVRAAFPVRIEHAGNLLTEFAATERWRAAGIVPVPQAVFLYNFGGLLPVYLGDGGKRGRFPFRSLLNDGWRLCASSDVLVGSEAEQTRPMFSIWCSIARRDYFGDPVEPEESVTIDDALLMHTRHAAEALGVGSDRGSLEFGKRADLIVLDRDPRTLPAESLRDVNVDFVFLGGQLVHERDGARPLEMTIGAGA
jgi:predicted amidohydrolase YtcJ